VKTFILFLGLAGAAASLSASPVLYNFNFSGGTPNATGSFDFDSSTDTFSNVIVIWNGGQFPSSNFTTSFNQSSPNFCGSVASPLAFFQILTQGTCGGAQWSAFNSPGLGGDEQYDLAFTFNGNSGVGVFTSLTSSAPIISTSGTVSASAAVPEPGSLALGLAGGALLAWKLRQRPTA